MKDQLSIIKYNSDVININSKIQLNQNLFSFLLEGQKSVQYAGTRAEINSDQFFLLSSGNCLMSEKIAAPNGRYRSILLFFDNQLLADFFIRHPQKKHVLADTKEKDAFLVFEKDLFLTNFTDSLGLMLASGQPLSLQMQKLKLEELLLYLTDHYPLRIQQLRNVSDGADDELLIRQAVTGNIDTLITVEELAFLCHMSLSTFKRRFAKIFSSTPNRWLLEKRMEKAAYLLKQGDCKVSELYLELGYENLSSFIQSFKQIHGVTPKQYQLTH
ncbi:helix-turn-helix domain-containing protein [Flavobacterium sp. HTF]|uniref:helix-turn-helix domain-containing protein n=1 Tax=Flavobacterium sp. HTF TaxID=2170732 RepID=UPI000D5C4419|nr:AraC family transcriptional regulator [Flavobacterium sp. HTF]PWB23982.1 AraC family transcriptional regulator [Flavobacterium sp. HTF]